MAANALNSLTTVKLCHSEGRMPILGFGVYQIDRADTVEACQHAISVGYRHIDTAQLYTNEAEVGSAISACGLPRDQVFVTTKIRYPRVGKGKTYLRALESVQKIDPRHDGYVDLFLIHTPNGVSAKDRKEMWTALEKLHEEGKAKAIGVSNYNAEHLEQMKTYAKVWPPAVNQILLHPWHQQRETVKYCEQNDIVLQAFSPLARGSHMEEPLVLELAKKHGKSVAQVLVRYSLQKGWVPLPKSEKPERITENADVFDFQLSPDDMSRLDDLDVEESE